MRFRRLPLRTSLSLFAVLAMAMAPGRAVSAAKPGDADRCAYRQASLSVPVYQVSSKEVGHPYRAMFGYCLFERAGFLLQQDWVLSYLDADPVDSSPGGEGVGLGSDFLFRWHFNRRYAFVPSFDFGAGIQYAAGHAFPADGSRWMFTVLGGLGWLIPVREKREVSLSLRYTHMSNAGFIENNSGYDVVHLVAGWRWGRSAD
jgi:hypothetical protein